MGKRGGQGRPVADCCVNSEVREMGQGRAGSSLQWEAPYVLASTASLVGQEKVSSPACAWAALTMALMILGEPGLAVGINARGVLLRPLSSMTFSSDSL